MTDMILNNIQWLLLGFNLYLAIKNYLVARANEQDRVLILTQMMINLQYSELNVKHSKNLKDFVEKLRVSECQS